MNAPWAEGFVPMGGPWEGTQDVLLIIRTEDREQIETRLSVDNRTRNALLVIIRITPWQLRPGSLP